MSARDLDNPIRRIEKAYATILEALGYSTANEHFSTTPERAALAMLEFRKNGDIAGAGKLLEVQYVHEASTLVIEGPIRVTSMCAHHMLPVTGWAWTGYIPEDKVCGLSKMARVVRYLSRQLTIQELLTQQVVQVLQENLEPLGAMCVIKATHGCMAMRGIEEPIAETATSAVRGLFKDDFGAKQEFLHLMEV